MWRATLNSWRGLIAAAKSEQAFREELVALAIAVPLAFLIAADAWKRLTLIGVILLLMAVELLNTAIEKLSDHVTAGAASRHRADQGHELGRGRASRWRSRASPGCWRWPSGSGLI